jgi:protease-4
MSDQPTGFETEPKMLAPAAPSAAYPPPPVRPRSGGGLRVAIALVVVFGGLAAVCVGGVYALGSMFTVSSDDVWIEEVHHSGNRSASDKIAIVTVDDVLYEPTAKYVLKQLKRAEQDERVKAIVLKVDSPGGTINASDHIHRKVQQICRDRSNENFKHIVVSMQSLAASGGYYVSVAADKIYAEPTTLTGSIGVIASFPNVAGLLDRFDVRWEVVKTGPLKDTGSPFRPMTEPERERLRQIIDDAFQRFIDIVCEGRSDKLDRTKVIELANGDIYTAREAKQSGLVDEIGYIEDAIKAAESLAGITDSHVIEYKRPLSLSDILLGVSARKPAVQFDLDSLHRATIPRVMYMAEWPRVEL